MGNDQKEVPRLKPDSAQTGADKGGTLVSCVTIGGESGPEGFVQDGSIGTWKSWKETCLSPSPQTSTCVFSNKVPEGVSLGFLHINKQKHVFL